MFFNGWSPLGRTVLVGGLAYVGLILFLRVSGKRTLSKLNAFDLVVTVALGSTLATIAVSADVALAQGLVALLWLIALQFAITWSSVRWPWVRRLITAEPSLLLHRGQYLHAAMRRARISEAELRTTLRAAGHGGPADIEAIVLESDGSFSVVERSGSAEAAVERQTDDRTGLGTGA